MAIAHDAFVIDGRYEVGDVLGRGGMGEVRRARDLRLNRDVAIKFLRADLAADPEARRRFEEEAHNAARLNHPNVVLVLDTGEYEGRPFLVMECLPGDSLHSALQVGPLSDSRVAWIARDVLAALVAAHHAGVIHRDVSPSNILLTDTGRAKLADFGIAKAIENASVTVSGQVVGTPGYLAPERLRGDPATPASDVFSLGVTLKRALGDAATGSALAAQLNAMTDPDPQRRPTAVAALASVEAVVIAPETVAIPAVTEALPATMTVAAAPEVTVVAPVVGAPVAFWRDRRAQIASVALVALVGLFLLLATNVDSSGTPTTTDETTPPTVTARPPTTVAGPTTTFGPRVQINLGDDDAPARGKRRGKAGERDD